MKKARAGHESVTQTSHSSAQSGSVEALRPHSGNPETQGRSMPVSPGSDTPMMLNHEEIMKRARAIWIQGRDKADWYEAEAQLRADRFRESSLK